MLQVMHDDQLTTPGAGRAPAALPARVRNAIRVQERSSEILIGWAQLAIVVIFGSLYALAPKAADSDRLMFEPVPYALAAYFLFIVIRLALAYRRMMPNWLVYLSMAVDMALLMGLIWTFHIQYGQPPAFYLKAPTLLYVFIFIALRALRYDARYVVTAGLLGAAGWLGLLAYALWQDPEGATLTRDFTAYMTGNMVLIGAEFDKVISILLVTAILAMALTRARRLLVAAVRESTAADDLKRFFSPEVASAITSADVAVEAGEGEARVAAIIMVDIRDFTRFASTIPPNDVIRLLTDYQQFMVTAIQESGGIIDKFLGDGIMASFGAARPSPTPDADALRAVEAVLSAAEQWNDYRGSLGFTRRLVVNAAAACGPVVFGAVGHEQRLEYTVIGDAVNNAGKLEKHNKREGSLALTTAEAYQRAGEQGFAPARSWASLPARQVQGLSQPLDLMAIKIAVPAVASA